MTPEAKDQLRNRAFDWLMSAIVGAVLSVVLSLIIIRQETAVQLAIIGISMGLIFASLVYFALLAFRYQRIVSRLGIVGVLKREGNRDRDWPTTAKFSYKFLGISAVNVLTDECATRVVINKRPKTLEVMHLDPACEGAVRNISEIQGRELEETKHNIERMIRMANIIVHHNTPSQVTLVPHPFIPSIRLVIIDDEIMYVGEYAPKSRGFFSDLIVLRNLEDRPSLFSTFQKYYDRTRDFAIYHLISRAVIRLITQYPSLSLEELMHKVTGELRGTVAEAHVTLQMVNDILREFSLDNTTKS